MSTSLATVWDRSSAVVAISWATAVFWLSYISRTRSACARSTPRAASSRIITSCDLPCARPDLTYSSTWISVIVLWAIAANVLHTTAASKNILLSFIFFVAIIYSTYKDSNS